MTFHGLGRRHIRSMLGHRHVIRIGRVVLCPDHESSDFVVGIAWLPTTIRTIHRVTVNVDIVTVVDPTVFRRLRVDVDLVFTDSRRPLIHPVRIAEVRLVNLYPVVHRPLAVDAVTGLRGHAVELVALFP